MIKLILGEDGYKSYCFGNIIKYRMRAGLKDNKKVQEDINKAEFYRQEMNKLK